MMILANVREDQQHAKTRPRLALTLVLLALQCSPVRSHGRLYEPPGRSTAFRRGFNTPANYDDMSLNCGGFDNQWNVQGGKCGVCGDPWQGPRENEAGGLFATGTIVRQYTMGEFMPIVIEITAPHKGWYEFRLCPHNDPTTPVSVECLDQYKLPIFLYANGTTVNRYHSLDETNTGWVGGRVYLMAKLPDDVTCTQCVLQWKWHTGNSWGTDPDGTSCVGCGPQEEFYGCADIAIYPPGQGICGVTLPTTTPMTNTTPTTTIAPTNTTATTATGTTVPTTTTTPTTTTAGAITCGDSQFQPDPSDVKCYYQCANNIPYHQCCPQGTQWSQSVLTCVWT